MRQVFNGKVWIPLDCVRMYSSSRQWVVVDGKTLKYYDMISWVS